MARQKKRIAGFDLVTTGGARKRLDGDKEKQRKKEEELRALKEAQAKAEKELAEARAANNEAIQQIVGKVVLSWFSENAVDVDPEMFVSVLRAGVMKEAESEGADISCFLLQRDDYDEKLDVWMRWAANVDMKQLDFGKSAEKHTELDLDKILSPDYR